MIFLKCCSANILSIIISVSTLKLFFKIQINTTRTQMFINKVLVLSVNININQSGGCEQLSLSILLLDCIFSSFKFLSMLEFLLFYQSNTCSKV